MSWSNRLDVKKWRRVERWKQKRAAAAKIPHCGVIVTKAMVKNQQYLRDQRLPHSKSVASVLIERTVKTAAAVDAFASGVVRALRFPHAA